MSYQRVMELRRQRKELAEQASGLIPNEGAIPAEARQQIERMHGEIDELDASIELLERQIDTELAIRESEARGQESRGVVAGQQDSDPQAPQTEASGEARAAREAWYRVGMTGCTEEQRHQLVSARVPEEVRAQASTLGATGGILIAQEAQQPLIQAQDENNALRSVAEVITTSHGREIPYPTSDDRANKGRRLGAKRKARDTQMDFEQKILGAHVYTSDKVPVPFELLQDTAYPLERHILENLGIRNGRIQGEEDLLYEGSGGPEGVLPAAKEGFIAPAGQTNAVGWEDMVQLEGSLDETDMANARYMFNRKTLIAFKLQKDGDGRPMWVPGTALREPATINGYPYTLNRFMPNMGPENKPVLFGDFRKVKIRQVAPPLIVRLNESMMDEGYVGFLMFERHDCKTIDAGTGPVRFFQNAA